MIMMYSYFEKHVFPYLKVNILFLNPYFIYYIYCSLPSLAPPSFSSQLPSPQDSLLIQPPPKEEQTSQEYPSNMTKQVIIRLGPKPHFKDRGDNSVVVREYQV